MMRVHGSSVIALPNRLLLLFVVKLSGSLADEAIVLLLHRVVNDVAHDEGCVRNRFENDTINASPIIILII